MIGVGRGHEPARIKPLLGVRIGPHEVERRAKIFEVERNELVIRIVESAGDLRRLVAAARACNQAHCVAMALQMIRAQKKPDVSFGIAQKGARCPTVTGAAGKIKIHRFIVTGDA